MVSASDIKELREITGAGMLDCRNALEKANGDKEKAIKELREKGLAAVAKKSGRIAAEGKVVSYIHMGGKIGVLAEINCETDFAAGSDAFGQLAKDITMQIAAANPLFVSPEEVPAENIQKEKEIFKVQAANEKKPAAIIEKMLEGKIKKYYQDVCLLEQAFIRDPSKTIKDILTEATLKIGEKISVRRFVRYEMGEGLAKREDNFAEEVEKQMAKTEDKKPSTAKTPAKK
jgi:elongation factor Ts